MAFLRIKLSTVLASPDYCWKCVCRPIVNSASSPPSYGHRSGLSPVPPTLTQRRREALVCRPIVWTTLSVNGLPSSRDQEDPEAKEVLSKYLERNCCVARELATMKSVLYCQSHQSRRLAISAVVARRRSRACLKQLPLLLADKIYMPITLGCMPVHVRTSQQHH